MPSSVSAYGAVSRAERDRSLAEVAAVRATLADELGPGEAVVGYHEIVSPLGECEWEPGHAPATDEVLTSRVDHGEIVRTHTETCRGCLPKVCVDALRSGAEELVVEVGVLQQHMSVWVADPSLDETVSHVHWRPGVRRLVLSVRCPACGELRGRPEERTVSGRGFAAPAHQWRNPCGHADELTALIAEADVLGGHHVPPRIGTPRQEVAA